MAENLPAWKRAGLVQKQQNKTGDAVRAGIKRNAESGVSNGPVKPPKKPKLPKSERKPAPEPDQLAYLRQFHDNKGAWKFSKQKQNWLLRNVFSIDDKYNDALLSYMAELKGASRERLITHAKDIVAKWNEFMSEDPANDADPKEDDVERPSETGEDAEKSVATARTDSEATDKKPPGVLKKSKKAQVKEPPKPKPPTEHIARRAQKLLSTLTGTEPALEYLD